MKPVLDFVERAAPTDSSVLLLGESGVGKEVIARALHRRSNRADGPFIAVNCAAIPDSLFEAELFGHEAGAFTGATTRRVGLFEAASRGTLLLDEIGELPLPAQAGLLRAVEERTITRVGGTGRIPVDVRIVAATHRDLEARIETGEFRSDLYYRLSVLVTRIPTLRERPDDVEALAHHFLTVFRQRAPRVVTGFSAEAIAALRRYAWPGNARELRNAIDRAVVLGESTQIELADLPAEIAGRSAPPALGNTHQVTLPMPLARLERLAIEAALKASGGNKSQAAIVLGIDRVTIYNKLKSYAKQDADRGSASEPEGV
jgi:transcriptional regulator with PAS, ATPase and Fis domain